MHQRLIGLGLLAMVGVSAAGCAEVMASRVPKNGVVLTTTHQLPTGYEVMGTVHAQSTIWRFFGAAIGPVMTDINQKLADEAAKLGANMVIGVEYSQDWLSYQANGTAVKINR